MDFSSVTRALQSLQRRRPVLDDEIVEISKKLLDETISNEDYIDGVLMLLSQQRWEPLAVGLACATDLLDSVERVYVEGPRVPSINSGITSGEKKRVLSKDEVLKLCGPLVECMLKNLEHSEPRVRSLVAKAVGAHVKVSMDYAELEEQRIQIYSSIVTSLYQHLESARDVEGKSKSSEGALDDTTGWRALETNWQGLASYIAACGSMYFDSQALDSKLLQACQYSCTDHVNRHVRAAGINVLEQLVICVSPAQKQLLEDDDSELRQTITQVLKAELADNWSQVRMAASVLCRTFLLKLKELEIGSTRLWPILVPRMCLNRFYLAQGVKLYSHDTWRMVFPNNGLEIVSQNVGAVCRYYVKMCDADNHAVREAACQAVAELAQKLGGSSELSRFVPMLLQALIMCFHDESWPVRDEACLACGTFCMAFPEECRPELNTLLERWLEQVTDQIWSVRENAAVALGRALEAYPELLDKMLDFIRKNLPSAKDQPSMTREEYKQHQNDVEAHTNSQLYSCGSLAPKLGKKAGAGRIGCTSCGVNRPKAPWEATDGCIYLLREILPKLDDATLLPLMTELADVCRVRHFPQSDDLRTTLWRQLPAMAHALGKQRFKRLYLELFLDLLMTETSTASQLSVHAAGQCMEELSQFVGPSIFRGRLDDYQQDYFDRTMRERKQHSQGPAMDTFSPFGPPEMLASLANPMPSH